LFLNIVFIQFNHITFYLLAPLTLPFNIYRLMLKPLILCVSLYYYAAIKRYPFLSVPPFIPSILIYSSPCFSKALFTRRFMLLYLYIILGLYTATLVLAM